ncbi:MAG: hypothetical protein FJW24_01065 [Acidimicrobiia bacterium]|nr:hypothetical protein [Acidimicrobiia bacterium]
MLPRWLYARCLSGLNHTGGTKIMNTEKRRPSTGWIAAAAAAIALTTVAMPALADEATGKVVWVDAKNNALLLECVENGCAKIPSAKTGETFTFVIPADLKNTVASIKEGQQVTVTYQAAQGAGYNLVAVK